MRLSTRYALYFFAAIALSALGALLFVAMGSSAHLERVEHELRRELKYSLMLDQQNTLSGIGNYLGRRLFHPLRKLDVAALNDEIREVKAWLPVVSFDVVDAGRKLVADGSPENRRYGLNAGDDHLEVFDLSTPHVYSLPEGYGLAFRVENGGTVAGYAHIVLADVSFSESIERATGSLDQISQRLQETFVSVGAAAMLAALGIGLAVGALLSRRLSRPLTRMSAAAREFAAGNLSYTIEEGAKDEIGTLAAALNRMARDLWRSNRLLAEAQSVARLGSWVFDCESGRFDWSEQCYVIFGVLRGAFVPQLAGVAERLVPADRAGFVEAFERGRLREAGGVRAEFRVIRFHREQRVVQCIAEWSQSGGREQLMGTFQDITERKLSEDKLSRLANFDTLTGLPNRYLFKDRLAQAMLKAERSGQRIALLFVDLDHFKNVNDTLGHDAGDELLKVIAERIRECVRSADTVARLGGDEFTVILENLASPRDAGVVAQHVIDAVSAAVRLGAHEVCVTPSIGVTLFPDDGRELETLIRQADTAMYRAKEQGRNGCRFFTSEMNELALERLALEGMLRTAAEAGDFELHFQPQADLRSGAIIGFEALLRWTRPDGVAVPPSRFVPILEDSGLIVRVGEWALTQACQWCARLHFEHRWPVSVSVNVSARQLQRSNLAAAVRTALQASGLPAEALELELTESTLLEAQTSLGTMLELKALGVRLAIDDFGTGYSSLTYLKRFPIDRLKVDRSFVRDIAVDHDDAVITETIITLAHSLGLRVIAEGVEQAEQLDFLRQRGCDEIQGYLLSRPQPPAVLLHGIEALREPVDRLVEPRTPARLLALSA